MQTTVMPYAVLRTTRCQKAAQEAWETPLVKVKDPGDYVSANRQTRHDRTGPPPRTRRHGGMTDPEGFAISPYGHVNVSRTSGRIEVPSSAEGRPVPAREGPFRPSPFLDTGRPAPSVSWAANRCLRFGGLHGTSRPRGAHANGSAIAGAQARPAAPRVSATRLQRAGRGPTPRCTGRSSGLPESDDRRGHGLSRPRGVIRGRRPTPPGNRPRVRCAPLDPAYRRGGTSGPRDGPPRGARPPRDDGAGDASPILRRPRPRDSCPDSLAHDSVLDRFPPSRSLRTQPRPRGPCLDHRRVRRRAVLPGRRDRAPRPHGRHGRPREPRGPLRLPVQRRRDVPLRRTGLLLGDLDPRALPPLRTLDGDALRPRRLRGVAGACAAHPAVREPREGRWLDRAGRDGLPGPRRCRPRATRRKGPNRRRRD